MGEVRIDPDQAIGQVARARTGAEDAQGARAQIIGQPEQLDGGFEPLGHGSAGTACRALLARQPRGDLRRDAGIAQTTLKRYLALLETSFLIQRLPPWSANLGKRLIKTPKLYLADTGLAAYLLGWGENARPDADRDAGRLLENFVFMELTKAIAWSRVQPRLYHFRAASGSEVDFVIEDRAGRCVGIEVKAGRSLGERDFSGLRGLRDALGARFRCGVVLYAGGEVVPLGRALYALPVQCLWATHSTAAAPA